MITIDIQIHIKQVQPDPDCGIEGGYELVDITANGKSVKDIPASEKAISSEIEQFINNFKL